MADSHSIVGTYNRLLQEDADITMPVAAIEALVELLAQSQASTVAETLTLLNESTEHLKASIPNPISLSAGTDLFQRYLISTLQRPGSSDPGGDFRNIKAHLLSNGKVFVSRAKASREKIAEVGKLFVRDEETILTNGGSRVVGALLMRAAEASAGSVRFKVIYVLPSITTAATEGDAIVSSLREKGVPVAVISESAVAYSLGKVTMVIVGAEGVVENGGIISRLGTYQMAMLAKAVKPRKPFFVVAESHKFVRLFPLGQFDLPIEQKVIDFKTGGTEGKKELEKVEAAVDFTPPELISALITENGVLTPSAVSEELIKIWY